MKAPSLAPAIDPAATLPDAWRIEVFKRADLDDPEGDALIAAAAELGITGIRAARTGRGYLLPPEVARVGAEELCRALLRDPVTDEVRLSPPRCAPTPAAGRRRILVQRKPGVMDPVAETVARALARLGLAPGRRPDEIHVGTFRAWEVSGDLSREDLLELGRRALANETIDDLLVDSEALAYGTPTARARHVRLDVPLRDADDRELDRTSRDGGLSLSTLEMRAIRAHYRALGREPSACELETLAQTWSEHCKHKTFTGIIRMDGEVIDNLLARTIQAATRELDRPWCVSVFHDNAGVVAFDRGFDLAFKVETHNHPSAIDPYGGAGTGIGGVIRDILGVGLGARPIANTDAFFVGPLDLPRSEVPRGTMHPARILRGVVAGVRDYGNRMGIPTVNGGVWVHPGYVGNPLVYAGTVGLIPHERVAKEVRAGDRILLVGGRTGRDGIHGATFSSAELHEESERTSAAAVQIGDPITEKRVLDALMAARDRGLYRGITDCGAGGLSSAVGEMAKGLGAEVDLEQVPLKYPGLAPEEIWISEAQERMVLAVPAESLEACRAVFASEDVEATDIGRFTDSGRLVLRHAGTPVGELDLAFLHGGVPRPERRATWSRPRLEDPGCPPVADPASELVRLLAAPDVASKEWILRQYDHEVGGMSVGKPLVGAQRDGPGDAAVLKPLADSPKGIAIACGANPRFGLLDPGAMAEAVIDEALRNAVAVGGDPDRTAILDNFSWGNCDKEDRLGALVLAAKGCHRAALAYGTPFISGKDSLNNEYRLRGETLSIPPTLLVSALAIVPDVARTVTMDLKREGSMVYALGLTRGELGGSLHLACALHAGDSPAGGGTRGGTVPRPDLETAPRLLRALHAAISAGLVRACHDLSEGGLAVAAAEMAFAGGLGLAIDLGRVPTEDLRPGFDPDATRLFSESCTRFLVEVAPEDTRAFERALAGLTWAPVGRVTGGAELVIRGTGGRTLVQIGLEELRRAHRSGFQG